MELSQSQPEEAKQPAVDEGTPPAILSDGDTTQEPVDGKHSAGSSGGSFSVVEDDKDPDAFDPDYVGPTKNFEQDFSLAQEADPQRQRPGAHGTYLDREQRKAAEINRARLEGREPDLDNPPPIAGTPVWPTEVLKEQFPGGHKIPVQGTQEVSVGTDDSTTILPEEHGQYVANGGELSDKHDDAVLDSSYNKVEQNEQVSQ